MITPDIFCATRIYRRAPAPRFDSEALLVERIRLTKHVCEMV
jgi:hypothetical protein